ncbi:MAG: DUF4912 domain-containing protein [Spirochaetales bacterium]|nr:DUF4912 domain-containing protein [Spirochaetales bacterium]
MTKERLQRLSDDNLYELARRQGIRGPEELDKDELIDTVLEILEEDRDERRSSNNLAMRIKEKKYDIILDEELISQITEDFPLPERYNDTRIVLMLRDPSWAFTYWDLGSADFAKVQEVENPGELFLRVYSLPAGEIGSKSYSDYFDIPLRVTDDSWYINLPVAGIRYCMDLMVKEYGKDVTLCRSNVIQAPRADIAREIKEAKTPAADAMYLSGLFSPGNELEDEDNPRRIISLLDNQYFHLTN